MRIAFVTHRYPPHSGGVERHVSEIANRLVGRGNEVRVLTADGREDQTEREERAGVTIRRMPSLAPRGAFYFSPGMVRAVQGLEVDVVHAHNYHALPLTVAAFARAGPFVATPHYHGTSPSRLRALLLRAYRPVGRRALSRADACLAVSDWEQGRLLGDLGVGSRVVPNGVDVTRFADAIPEQMGSPYLLTVGRLEEYKGVQHAIGALSQISTYRLVVAGEGPYRSALERKAESAGVADRVRFLGRVDDDRLPGLYAGASAHLNLSTFEAYGMTVAEALASGTPSVVLDATALHDWIGVDGVVGVDDTRPITVSEAIQHARSAQPDPASLPRWDEVVDRIEETYTEVIESR